MSNHRISGLADPTDAVDTVTRRYVASRFQALSDEVQDRKSKLGALQNLFGVENNQVLIRKYEIIDATFNHVGGGGGGIVMFLLIGFKNIHLAWVTTLAIINLMICLLLKNIFIIYLKNLQSTLHG